MHSIKYLRGMYGVPMHSMYAAAPCCKSILRAPYAVRDRRDGPLAGMRELVKAEAHDDQQGIRYKWRLDKIRFNRRPATSVGPAPSKRYSNPPTPITTIRPIYRR
jgi:hypothetical protein